MLLELFPNYISKVCDSYQFSKNYKGIKNISLDSRKCDSDSLFIPIVGNNVDGHDFINNAIQNGCKSFFCSKSYFDKLNIQKDDYSIFLFNDTQDGLIKLFTSMLEYLNSFNIAITGSSAKTTVKEIIASVLKVSNNTFSTLKNFNSIVGLPLSLNSLEDKYDYCVWECGVSNIGEMDIISDMIKPKITVITNIGTAHIGNFENQDTIASEKFKLAKYSQVILCPKDCKYLDYFKSNTKAEILTFEDNYDYIDKGLDGQIIKYNGIEINTGLIGNYNRLNIACAITLSKYLNISDYDIKRGIENLPDFLLENRGNIKNINEISYIVDCYNANPESMKMALLNYKKLNVKTRKIAIIGDMRELGDYSISEHKNLKEYLDFLDYTYFVGLEFQKSKPLEGKCKYFDNVEQLKTVLKLELKKYDTVLVKGSRGIGLENIFK